MPVTMDNRADWRIVDGTLPNVVLERPTTVKDVAGGPRSSWAQIATCVGDLQPAVGAVKERFAQLGLVIAYTLFLNVDVAALAGDRFRIGARLFLTVEGGYDGGYDPLTGWPGTAHVNEIPGEV